MTNLEPIWLLEGNVAMKHGALCINPYGRLDQSWIVALRDNDKVGKFTSPVYRALP